MSSPRRHCPICQRTPVISLPDYSAYYYCPNCQTAWLKKIPLDKYTKSYYQGQSSLAVKLFQLPTSFFYWLRGTYAPHPVKLWLDVGAGDGGFLKTIQAKRKIGVEISKSGRAFLSQLGLETMSDSQFLKSRGLQADVISFWHSLEHVKLPQIYLRTAKLNLKPGGVLIIAVPNISSLEFKFFKQYWFHLVPKFHLWHFSLESLNLLLKREQMIIDQIDYFCLEHNFTGLLQSFVNYFSHTDNVLQRLFKRSPNQQKIPISGWLWSIFWLSLGLPLVILIYLIEAIFHLSGTIIINARHAPISRDTN